MENPSLMIPANMRRRIPIIKVHPSISIAKGNLSTHTLTRRSTCVWRPAYLFNPFQLTTSHGGRLLRSARICTRTESFNSRPHTEVDCTAPELSVHRALSTHDLTRRSTCLTIQKKNSGTPFNSRPHTEVDCCLICFYYIDKLSTHDLTRRSTLIR